MSAPLHSDVGPAGEDGDVPNRLDSVDGLLAALNEAGVRRGDFLSLCTAPDAGLAVAWRGGTLSLASPEPSWAVAQIEDVFRPRWVWWCSDTPAALAHCNLRLATCWDLAAVHRLLFGGWRADPSLVWAALHDLPEDSIPATGQLNLLGHSGEDGLDLERPLRPDGHLRPEWVSGGWIRSLDRLARWTATALVACDLQRGRLSALQVGGDAEATARSESAAELLCVDLLVDGLPIDVTRAEQLIGSFIGGRPADAAEAMRLRRQRDAPVLQHSPGGDTDLRNPAQVRAMLARLGIDIPDTRAWRLEVFRGAHPVIEELLKWRKAERIATTYGYSWLDDNVGPDDRLRGVWTGSDGAAGRMTASAGLHNLPADLRPAVAAGDGHMFIRADLGQIEPRVLAAVSGDQALARATADDDLYAPVASRLGVERAVAKVAVLAAMYGQTSGAAGQALRGLESAYPVAMRYLNGCLRRRPRRARRADARRAADPDVADPVRSGRQRGTGHGRVPRAVRPQRGDPGRGG